MLCFEIPLFISCLKVFEYKSFRLSIASEDTTKVFPSTERFPCMMMEWCFSGIKISNSFSDLNV